VVFESDANNLVAGDTNGQSDIFRVANPFITSFNATGAKNTASALNLASNAASLTEYRWLRIR
jgi:hypothetical protein